MARSLQEGLGVVLQRRRARAGVSQEALAHLAGIDRTYVNEMERGKANPSLSKIEALAEALRTRPSALILAAERELR